MADNKKSQKPTSVADYINTQVNLCGKTQRDIAVDAGFPNPNMVTMIKQGRSKLPLDKIGTFAKAIGVDPIHLFRMVMLEYMPETWVAIQKMFDQPVLTQNEIEIIEAVREANVENPRLRTDVERQRLIEAIETLKPDNAVND